MGMLLLSDRICYLLLVSLKQILICIQKTCGNLLKGFILEQQFFYLILLDSSINSCFEV